MVRVITLTLTDNVAEDLKRLKERMNASYSQVIAWLISQVRYREQMIERHFEDIKLLVDNSELSELADLFRDIMLIAAHYHQSGKDKEVKELVSEVRSFLERLEQTP